jgi:hypothetical protein
VKSNIAGNAVPWPADELRRIAAADNLHISPFRDDGVTYGTPTWIWSVAVGDALYVQAYNGELALVSGGDAAEGRENYCRWNDAGSQLRAGGRVDARPHRRSLSREVSRQPLSESDDRSADAVGNDERVAAKVKRRGAGGSGSSGTTCPTLTCKCKWRGTNFGRDLRRRQERLRKPPAYQRDNCIGVERKILRNRGLCVNIQD